MSDTEPLSVAAARRRAKKAQAVAMGLNRLLWRLQEDHPDAQETLNRTMALARELEAMLAAEERDAKKRFRVVSGGEYLQKPGTWSRDPGDGGNGKFPLAVAEWFAYQVGGKVEEIP